MFARHKLTNKTFFFVATLASAVVIGISCTKNTGGGSSSYSGPGSHYTISTDSGSYVIKKYANTSSSSEDFIVTASASSVNGFLKFSVTGSSGSGGPAVGSTAYGLEVPGMAMFIKPLDSGNPDQIIAAVASGKCPTSNINANWIIVKQSGGSNVSSTTQDTFGTFTYTESTRVASVAKRYSLAAPTTDLGSNTFSSATCSNGIMSVAVSGDTAIMYLTAVGGAIVNTASVTSSNASYIFALPVASITPTLFSGTYSGFVYMGSQSSGSKFKAIKFTVTGAASSMTGTGNVVTDVDTDTLSAQTVSLNLTAINSPSSGLMTGTLTSPGGTSQVACMAVSGANSTTKNIINCAGADPGDTTKLFNFLLVSR
jgi:hypothetical protein